MAEKKDEAKDPETDEYGLAIQKYHSVVLLVVPASGYSEEALRHARASLYNVHVGTYSVSTESDELVKGRLQDEFLVDGPLDQADMADYSGILLVDGDGCAELAADTRVLELVRAADRAGKLIGAWGGAVEILARAGVVRGRKVTGAASLRALVKEAGGKFTGTQVERSGHVVTALDDAAGLRFGKALVAVVGIL